MKILMSSLVDLKKAQHNRPHQLARYLSRNHQLTIISVNDWWKDGNNPLGEYSKEFKDIFDKVEYEYLTDKVISPFLQDLFCRKTLNSVLAREQYDVHLNYNNLISGWAVTKKVKTVFDVSDDIPAMIGSSEQIPKPMRHLGSKMGAFYIRKIIEKANYVTLTSDCLRHSCHVPSHKVKIIPNGVDTDLFQNYGDTKDSLGLTGFTIGYVGVLREWVDMTPVFAALRDLGQDVRMVVVGKEGFYDKNVQLARDYGVSERVTFTGTVSYSDVPKYISAMDVCLIPFSLNDISLGALPLKLFEYMACEKAVITAPLPAVKDLVRDRVFYASAAAEYRNSIKQLYDDQALRNRMGRDGRYFVKTQYNWEAISRQMENVLKQVCEG